MSPSRGAGDDYCCYLLGFRSRFAIVRSSSTSTTTTTTTTNTNTSSSSSSSRSSSSGSMTARQSSQKRASK